MKHVLSVRLLNMCRSLHKWTLINFSNHIFETHVKFPTLTSVSIDVCNDIEWEMDKNEFPQHDIARVDYYDKEVYEILFHESV